MQDDTIIFKGNLTHDPDLRFTENGTPVCNLRVARNYGPRPDGTRRDATFMSVNVWREQGEHTAASLSKGDRVIVVGRINTRHYVNREGITVYVTEINADDVGLSTKWKPINGEASSNKPVDTDLPEDDVDENGELPF